MRLGLSFECAGVRRVPHHHQFRLIKLRRAEAPVLHAVQLQDGLHEPRYIGSACVHDPGGQPISVWFLIPNDFSTPFSLSPEFLSLKLFLQSLGFGVSGWRLTTWVVQSFEFTFYHNLVLQARAAVTLCASCQAWSDLCEPRVCTHVLGGSLFPSFARR